MYVCVLYQAIDKSICCGALLHKEEKQLISKMKVKKRTHEFTGAGFALAGVQ